MKITRRHNITSTSGVTLMSLISASPSPSPLFVPATSVPLRTGTGLVAHVSQQHVNERFCSRLQRLDAAIEVVEHRDGRQRDEQTNRGGGERLRQRGHDGARADVAARLRAELVEGADDLEDGAEQADERRVVADGAEEGEAALEAQALHLGGAR